MDQRGRPRRADPGFGTAPLSNHWRWRPEWGSDRPCLWWYLTFEDQPGPRRLGQEVQGRLHDLDYLDVIAPRWLHLTVQDIAFADQLSAAQVGMLAEAAVGRLSDCPPRQLRVGPLATMPGAIVVRVPPAEAFTRIRRRLTTAMDDVGAEIPTPAPYAISPHVSLAYVNRDCDAREVAEVLSGVSAEGTRVEMKKLTLAAVTRKDRCYQWRVCAEIPLTGRPGIQGQARPAR